MSAPLPTVPRLAAMGGRASAYLGCRLPILGGAMTWVSERTLVAAISAGGGFGVLACGAMPPDRLAEEIEATRRLTDRPFGVNLIVLHPELDRLVEVCLGLAVSHIVLAGGLPPRDVMRRIREAGAHLLCFAPSAPVAARLIRQGADGLIIEGSEAGGHIGPVSTMVLAQEVLPEIREVPVFVAGGIGHGQAIAALLEMGAAGVQMGTRFAAAEESIAHPAFKQAFVRASARDAQPSVQIDPRFKVIPVRALQNAATRRFIEVQHEVIGRFRRGELGEAEAQLAIEHFWAGALRRAVVEGDVENGSLMAGQSVGLVKSIQPVATIMAELALEAESALGARGPIRAGPVPV